MPPPWPPAPHPSLAHDTLLCPRSGVRNANRGAAVRSWSAVKLRRMACPSRQYGQGCLCTCQGRTGVLAMQRRFRTDVLHGSGQGRFCWCAATAHSTCGRTHGCKRPFLISDCLPCRGVCVQNRCSSAWHCTAEIFVPAVSTLRMARLPDSCIACRHPPGGASGHSELFTPSWLGSSNRQVQSATGAVSTCSAAASSDVCQSCRKRHSWPTPSP